MQTEWPKITVSIVVRNGVRTIEHAIQSLLDQRYPNLEFQVLDAASTDGTVAILEKYKSHMSYYRSHPDRGAPAGYNEAIEKATGELVAFLNADDWLEPGILQAVGEAFRADPQADIITSKAHVWQSKENGEPALIRTFDGKSLQLAPEASPIPNARFWRRDLFARHGNFLETNHMGERIIACDLEFMIRLSQYPIRNVIIDRVGYNYLMHADSITFGANPVRMRQMYRERQHIAKTYLGAPALAGHKRRLKRWHRRGSARDFFWRMQEGDYRQALDNARQGMRVSGPLWLLDALRLGLTGGYRL